MKNEDVELIQRVLTGDDDAFSVLVRKYQKQVHALAWRKIGDFHIAEEITQDTFLKAYKRLATLKEPQRFVGWLYVIAANRCSSWLRKKRLWTQSLEHLEQADKEQLEKAAYSEYVVEENKRISGQAQRDVVKKLLAKLEESERTVMTLHYFGEMSCTEIGTFLGVSANTVKSRLRRAQQRLKKEEPMIREALDNFQISPNLTDTIMREILRMKPAAPSNSKPLVPWAIAASTLAVVLLMLGFGNHQYLARFQKPYSLDATAEMTVEIVDAPIVANLESKSDVRTQIGSANALEKRNNPEQQPNDTPAAIAEAQGDEIVEDWTKWELPKKAKARLGKGRINVMQFSPDGSQLAVGSHIGIWLYDVKTGKEISLFPGICGSLAFSPDGRLLANGRFGKGGFGQELELWEITTRKKIPLTNEKIPLTNVIAPAIALHFSEDSKTLVSVDSWGSMFSRSDIETCKIDVTKLEGQPNSLGHMTEAYAFSHDKVAGGKRDGKIRLWDTTTGKKLTTLSGHAAKNPASSRDPLVLTLAFSPDGTLLASGSKDTTVLLWDTGTNNDEPIILRKHTGRVNALAFSPDGKLLVSGSSDKTVLLWDTTTRKFLAKLTGHTNAIAALTFSSDGTTLASASTDGTVLFWNTETRDQLPTRITGHTKLIKAVAFLKDSTALVSVAFNGVITSWDLKTSQKTVLPITASGNLLKAVAFSPDGTKLASYSNPGPSIRLTDISTGRELANLTVPNSKFASRMAFSPDGKTVTLGCFGKIWVWNTETGENFDISVLYPDDDSEMTRLPHVIGDLVFSSDGKKLVSATDTGKVQMWDAETGVALDFTLAGQDPYSIKKKRETVTAIYVNPFSTLGLSPNGALIAVGFNNRIRITESNNVKTLKEISNLKGVETLVFAPDSTMLVIGFRNGGIELWDIETEDKLTTLDGHTVSVEKLVFSPDGKTLVSTGQDGTILVWDWDEVLKGTDKRE